jgi:hypothetical protein
MRWNRFRFENEIAEECEVTATLPNRNDTFEAITVAENIRILPIQGTENPAYNPTIETLHGPFWQFTDTHAISSYEVMKLPIDAVKNQLKAAAAEERWRREVGGFDLALQDQTVRIDTARGARDVYAQQYMLLAEGETVYWKFPSCWLTLTKAELGTIAASVTAHVNSAFAWEVAKIAEIDACVTLEELAAVVLREPVDNPGPGVL